MAQVDDLTAGDATPKVARASIKDLTTAVNRLSYAFKTPDTLVSPDALQLSSDGNLSLGGVPLVYSTVGRSILVQDVNNATLGAYSSSNNAILSARTSNATSGYAALELRKTDDTVMARLRYTPNQGVVKLDINNAGSTYPMMRFNPTGEVTIGDTTSIIAKFQILSGIAGNGSENAVFLQSSAPTTTPVMVSGANGGSVQIAGGNNVNGSGRGGQIDFNSATWTAAPGTIVFRSGLNTDGAASAEVGRFTPLGRLAVSSAGSLDPQATIHARTANGTRGRIIIEGINDYAGFTARRVNGTYAAMTPVLNGDSLLFLNAHGAISQDTFLAGPAFSCVATENWTTGKSGTAWVLYTTPNGTTSVANPAMYWANNGYVGVNNTNPQARLVVSDTDGGNSLEVVTGSTVTTLQGYNRSSSQYTRLNYWAADHLWTYGSANTGGMYLSDFGKLGVNTNVTSGGTGNTLVDGRVIISDAGNASMLMFQNGTAYAGMKIKSGPMHASSGGVNYYDVTVRPGDASTGVGSVADKTLLRFEAAQSINPRLMLQPTGGSSQVIIGDPTSAQTGPRVVIQNEGNFNSPGLAITGKDMSASGVLASADAVIRRAGAVTSTAGLMPWLQLESSDAAFAGNNAAAIGAAANSLQIWNYISNAWVQKFVVDPGTTTNNNSFLVNAGSNQSMTVRGPASNSGSIVLQSNKALGVAFWASAKTSGYMHIGGNGSNEPAIGAAVIASSTRNVGLWPLNETQMTYTYNHGGTFAGLHINNTDTTSNAQAHLVLASGQTNIGSSAIGTVSWCLPNISNTGTARLVNIGASTEANHTAANAQGYFVISTKNSTDSTAVPRIRVRASGNVNFGNSFDDSSRLYIFNEGRNIDGITVDMSDSSTTTNSSFVSERGGTPGYSMMFNVANSLAGTISHPSISTTSYGTSSDRRIKKNIVPAPSAGAIIDSFRVVSHDFIADNYHVPYGFVAQELYESYPPAVVAGDDELDVGPGSKIWQVDNSKLVPLLVKEVQESRQEKAEMKAEMAGMRQELAELRELVNLLLQDKSK